MKKLIISITLLLIATPLISAEIIPVWHKQLQDGIQDIELLKGGDEFMLTTGGGEIQIRSTESGELIRSHIDTTKLFMNGYFELTPDSTRVVMGISGLLQLISLENFERLNYFAFSLDTIAKGFTDIVLDPVKPYAYVIITGWEKTSGKDEPRSKISVYNYETMQLVKDLTDYSKYKYTAIDVSADGRYLATLNDGKAYLKVWDLSTMELIRDVQLWDDYLPTDWWCKSEGVQFSKLNSDVVYYSGIFPRYGVPDTLPSPGTGLRRFTISTWTNSNNIQGEAYTGKIIMFDNEIRALVYGSSLCFSNLEEQKVELLTFPEIEYPLGVKTVLSEKYGLFIGFSGQYIGAIKYDRGTSVESPTKEITISPNPTGSFVNVGLECSDPQINYQISDVNGLLISEGLAQSHSGSLQIDFSPYPAGIYFLTINCGDSPLTYKVIRE